MGFYEKYFLEDNMFQNYSNSQEQLKELFCFLDILLNVVLMIKVSEEEKKKLLKGIPIKNDDVISALTSYELQNYSIELSEEIKKDIAKAKAHLIYRSTISEKTVFLRFNYVVKQFYLSNIEVICLLLGLALEYDKKYEIIYSAVEDNKNSQVATKGLAISIMELLHSFSEDNWSILANEQSNLYRFILERNIGVQKQENLYSQKLYLNKRVARYLFGDDSLEESIDKVGELFDSKEEEIALDIHKEIAESICQVVQEYKPSDKCMLLHLVGIKGIGKTTVLKYVAKTMGISLLFVDISVLLKQEEKIEYSLDKIFLESALFHAMVCLIYDGKEDDAILEEVCYYMQKNFGIFFLLSSKKLPKMKKTFLKKLSMEFSFLSVQERLTLWNVWKEEYPISKEVSLELIASKYLLTPKEMQEVLDSAWLKCCSDRRKEIIQKDITFAVHQQNANQLGSIATQINAVFTWEDLIVEEDQKEQMELICNQLKNRGILEEEWGFGKKMPYGKGISALFYGSPGTGKTMAAQVMANELELDLYRIDLSQIVSKYIGETEKNIAKLFEKAKNINALLFFDEADSLFAKRSEVKDSHDRNANMETAYLLQKLEEYEGISILATNYLNNIDEAFKRRIRFIVNFSLPSAEIRYKLWTTLLPKEAKAKDNIDFEFFAKQFEFSGSNIKEILINASHMAIAEEKAISNYYIIQAIKNNFQKNGKLLIASDFGEYEALF